MVKNLFFWFILFFVFGEFEVKFNVLVINFLDLLFLFLLLVKLLFL